MNQNNMFMFKKNKDKLYHFRLTYMYIHTLKVKIHFLRKDAE